MIGVVRVVYIIYIICVLFKSKFTLHDECIVMEFRTKSVKRFFFGKFKRKWKIPGKSEQWHDVGGGGGGGAWQIACKLMNLIKIYSSSKKSTLLAFSPSILARLLLKYAYASGGSMIFPRRGRQLSGGAPTYDFAKFSQKLHEIERIWTPRGRGARVQNFTM